MRRIRSKPSHEPVLGLFALQRTSDLPRPIPPTWNEPDLVLRTEQGAFTPVGIVTCTCTIRLATGFHPQWKVSGRLTNLSCLTRHRAPHCENVVRMEYAPRTTRGAATAARPVKPRPGARRRRARGWV